MVADRVRLPVRFDPAGLRADAEGFAADEWVPHFNTQYYEGEWSGVSLRSVGGGADTLYPDPNAEALYAETPLLERCPHVRDALAWFGCPLKAVRFLRLAPAALIREHPDFNLGFEDGEVRIHIPVVSNAGVEFLLDARPVVMAEGEAWYLNLNLRHAVRNFGTSARIHLVVDCVVDEWLSGMLEAYAVSPAARP
jgi:hypothetical protein